MLTFNSNNILAATLSPSLKIPTISSPSFITFIISLYNFAIFIFKSNKILAAILSPSLKIDINRCSVPI